MINSYSNLFHSHPSGWHFLGGKLSILVEVWYSTREVIFLNYADFKKLIVNSLPNDWKYDDELGRHILKDDIRISILSDSFDNIEDFHEPWARKFPDPNAKKKVFFLQFNGVTIEQFFVVGVDGFRSYIPYPSLPDMTITKEQYSIGNIVNDIHGHDFKGYLTQAGIKVI